MPSWKKVITSGSDASLSSLVVTGGITGSLQGTASYALSALNASTASYFSGSITTAETASYVLPLRQDVQLTGSLTISGSTTQIGTNNLLGQTNLSGSIYVSGSMNALADFTLGGTLRLDPAQDPGNTNETASFLFTSASNTAQGYDLYYRQDGNLVKFKWLEGGISSGLLYGGVISASGATIYVSSGSGVILDPNASFSSEISPQFTYVTWPNYSASATYLTSSQNTYLYVDNLGVLHQQTNWFDQTQYEQAIPLGRVTHPNYATITGIGSNVQTTYDSDSQQSAFIRGFGPLKIDGFSINAHPGTLGFGIGSGVAYTLGGFYSQDPNSPSHYNGSAFATSSIARAYRSGSGVRLDNNGGAFYSTVDPDYWDDGTGVLNTMAAGDWQIQRVFANPVTGRVVVYYGQNTYTTLLNALQYLATDSFTEGEFTAHSLIFVGYLVLKGQTNNLTDTNNNQIINAGIFRNIAGGSSGGGAVAQTLNDLGDVTITTPTNGQALVYSAGIWENGTPSLAATASYVQTAQTASYVLNAVTASYSETASYVNPLQQNVLVTGSLIVSASGGTNDFRVGTNKLFVSASGNVGIGTTTPLNKLTIQDTVGDPLRINVPDDTKFNRVVFQKPSQTWSVGAINTNDFAIADENAVTYRLRILSGSSNFQINSNGTGSVSIGTTATSASLHVNNTGTGNSFLVEDSTNPDSSPFVIDNSGAVAIGQTSSLSGIKLTVNGNTLLNNNYLCWTYDGASNNDYIVSNDSPHGGTGNTPGFYVFKHDSTLSVASGSGNSTLDAGSIWMNGSTQTNYIAGNVGIGITTPSASLHVNNTSPSASFLVEDSTNPDTTPFVIDAVGNVAIGTGSAFEKVTIQNGNIALKDLTNSTPTSIVFTTSDTSSRNYITTLNSSSATDDYMKVGSWFGSVHLTTGNITSPTTHLFVSRSGNIGVGITSSLNAKLHVNNTSTGNSFLVEDSTNPDSTPFVIDASGNVGIGTTTPTALLHISSSTPSILTIERSINANAHIQYKNSASAMWAGLAPTITNGYFGIGSTIDLVSASFVVMSGSGNVGIGTTTPNARLDVSGSAIVTGSLTVTQGITGSLFGTASWAQNAATSSYVLNSVSSSFASTASFLNTLNQDLTFNGNLTLNGTASISYLNVLVESASVIYSSGSNQLGDATNDTQTLIGTTVLSGSLQLTGSANLPNITGSLLGTASYAVNADTASVANLALSVGTLNQILIVSGSSNNGTSLVRITQTGTGNAFLVEDEANVDSTPFVIDTTGNVGIGTLTPNAKLDVVGNAIVSGSLNVTGVISANLTGSVFGTSSWARNAVTASYIVTAQTASYVLNAVSSSFATTSATASYVVTAQTASYVLNAVSASFATSASRSVSSSFATTAQTASYVLNAVSASFATSASRAVSASFAPNIYNSNGILNTSRQLDLNSNTLDIVGNTGTFNVNIDDSLSTGQLSVTNAAASIGATGGGTGKNLSIDPSSISLDARLIVYTSKTTSTQPLEGTTINLSDNLIVTGSVGIGKNTAPTSKLDISGSALITGSLTVTQGITGSLFGTSSWARNAVTASFITTAQTASYVLNAVSSSFASTASFVNTLNQNVIITGSVAVTQNITASAFATTNALITSTATTINSGITTIYNIPTASYDGAWFDYTIRSGSNARAGSIMGIWSGSAVNYAETTTTDFGNTSGFALGMNVVGANMILSSSATTSGWSFNAIVRSV